MEILNFAKRVIFSDLFITLSLFCTFNITLFYVSVAEAHTINIF